MVVNILLAAFFCVILYGIVKNRILEKDKVSTFWSKESTGAMRGVAIVAIMFAHICQDEPSLASTLVGGRFAYLLIFAWGGIGVAVFFMLSGYGCFLSINKTDNQLKWFVKHGIKMLIYFVISFVFAILVRVFILGEVLDVRDCLESFISLKLPGTSSWYVKIQLLCYLLLAVSAALKKNQCYIVSALVLAYALIAYNCGLPDYWWKTSMCFAAGCFIARYKDIIAQYSRKIWVMLVVVIVGAVSFIYTIKAANYILIPQLIAYISIASCIIFVWDWIAGKNRLLENVGKTSLALYLIHIGVVDTVYALQLDANVKTLIFVAITAVGTYISYTLSEKSNKLLTKSLDKNA